MSGERGVKVGDIRGKYNSKYKTEEEKVTARKERQKQYYNRKKYDKCSSKSSCTTKIENDVANEALIAKEKEIKLLNKKLADCEKYIIVLERENDILTEKLEACVTKKELQVRSRSPIKEDSETFEETSEDYFSTSENVPVVEKQYSEEEIMKYSQERKKNKKNFDYDIHIEKIIADRNRLITD